MAVSGFRLRESNEIGCRVTLRGKRMYEFLDRLINVALPRIRDFRGVNPKSFDGNGNYSMGLAEQLVFPEIDPDKVTFTQGMDITFVHDDHERRRGPRTAPRLRHAVPGRDEVAEVREKARRGQRNRLVCSSDPDSASDL